MNEHDPTQSSMHPAADTDAWLESLLRRDAASTPYIEDRGFTVAGMDRLPTKRNRAVNRWIVPAMGVLGFLIGLVGFSRAEYLSLNLSSLASFESFSLRNLLIVALPLGMLYWLAVGAAWQQR